MKNYYLYLTFLFLSIGFISCQDEIAAPDNTSVVEQLAKKWRCSEVDGTSTRTYDVVITKDAISDGAVYLDNFGNFGSGKKIKATLVNLKLTIAVQNIDNNTVSGSGTVSSDFSRIDWLYTIDDHLLTPAHITATYTLSLPTKKSIK